MSTPAGQNPGEVEQTPVPVDPSIEIVTDTAASDDLLAGLDPAIVAEVGK